MRTRHITFLSGLILMFFCDRPKQSPSQWCCEKLQFDEPDNRGPFSLAGREYMREVVDSWADPAVTDHVLVFGSQSGKTGGVMGGAAWMIRNDPARIFWVMPTMPTVKKFSRTRWQPMLKRSPAMAELIPGGRRRHDFSTYEQIIGSAIVDMVWSNSPSALSGTPARIVVLDEVDKFDEGGRKEADAVNLAEQRTKRFANPKRFKTSTPTLVEGLIWQEFQKTDQRRRFMPCPFCAKFLVLIWSKNYTVFKITGDEAEVRWDKEAKRPDGSWDLDRVERSARYECPHCGGHIKDAHKTAMDRGGVWRPTAQGARGYRGWHLSSLYASSAECNVGKLAVKFLQAKESLLGLQGFINGDLAEPYMSQDTRGQRVEIITAKVEASEDGASLMTVDCQAKAPHFWYSARRWRKGDSHGIAAGCVDTWEELREKQLENKVADACVCIDSGYGAKSDSEVYKNCLRFGEVREREDEKPIALGWMPAKGMPGYKRWKDQSSELLVPYYLRGIDPLIGTSDAGKVEMSLFEFSGDFFKDILKNLREGKAGNTWSIDPAVATDVYWHHMDAESKIVVFNKMTGRTQHLWRPKSQHWPNHLFDCEVLQVALANFLGLFAIEEKAA